jgi:hypothetical protein
MSFFFFFFWGRNCILTRKYNHFGLLVT